jgi:hypothetical protein
MRWFKRPDRARTALTSVLADMFERVVSAF